MGRRSNNIPSDPMGYNDASFEEGRSTSGYNIMWQGATVPWASTKQASTAWSTFEAEIYALSEGAKDLVYFRKFLSGLGVAPSGPSPCATDNQGARDLAYNPEHHRRSKHIARRHFYIRDMVPRVHLVLRTRSRLMAALDAKFSLARVYLPYTIPSTRCTC